MILGNIHHTQDIENLHPLLAKLFDYLRSHDLTALPDGHVEVDGDRIHFFIGNNDLNPAEGRPLEGHRQYIDVHVPLSGTEIIGWRSLTTMGNITPTSPYDAQNDFLLYQTPSDSYITVPVGSFLIAFPDDLHAPLIGTGKLRKIIAKVKI